MKDARDRKGDAGERDGLPQTVTVKELAAALKISPKSVYDMASRDEIPGRVAGLGRRLRFNKALIDRWLAGGDLDN